MSNPYNVPWSFSYAIVLTYLGFVFQSDWDGTVPGTYDGPSDDINDSSGYDTITWLSGTAKPSWSTIQANAEAACVIDWISLNPMEYRIIVMEYDKAEQTDVDTALDLKQDHSVNLDEFSEIDMAQDVKDMLSMENKAAIQDHLELDTAAFEAASTFLAASQKGANSGVATLDSGGKIPTTQLPGLAITSVYTAVSQVAQLALTTQEGDVVVRSDQSKTYVKNAGTSGTMTDFTELLFPTGGVTSFNGRTGAVSPASGDYSASDITGFTEAAQDSVAAALSSEFNYNDSANTIALRSKSFTNNASRSLVTGTGATGFQVSSTRDAIVNYNITTSTTATIGGASSVTVVLEIAPTNSVTAGDWIEIGRISNSQTITLAIVLQSVQVNAGQLGGVVPAGYYAKLRILGTSGTQSSSYNTGQEVLL